MHVEVNEINIDMFGLVERTGNSKEELLRNAEEALKNGYTLYCQIPDGLIDVNAFEHFNSEPAPQVRDERFEVQDGEGNTVKVYDDGVEVVQGEVVENEEDE